MERSTYIAVSLNEAIYKSKNLRSKLLLLCAPRSGGGGVEGIEGLGERKKGAVLEKPDGQMQPLIPISQNRSIT